jgi:hypothetical protein
MFSRDPTHLKGVEYYLFKLPSAWTDLFADHIYYSPRLNTSDYFSAFVALQFTVPSPTVKKNWKHLPQQEMK